MTRLLPSSRRSAGVKALTVPFLHLYPKNDVSRVIAFLLASKPPKYPLAVYFLKLETPNLHSSNTNLSECFDISHAKMRDSISSLPLQQYMNEPNLRL